jgi:serine/threonine protein kinase
MRRHAEKIRLINKQLAQETEELHSLMTSQMPLPKRKVTLRACFDNGEEPIEVVDRGDDGLVFKKEMDGKVMAVKIIDKNPAQDFLITRAFIAKDQMYREFKALEMIHQLPSKHPNFLELYSTELDEFKVTTEEVDHNGHKTRINHDAWAIRVSFEENLRWIADAKHLFGHDHTSKCVEARCASAVSMHILSQMAASLNTLRSLGIRHRDLDGCNVKLKVPEMTLKIFDFSRADLSRDNTIKPPNEMMLSSYKLPIEEFESGHTAESKASDDLQMIQKDKKSLFQKAYIVPHTLNPSRYLQERDEPSDFEALRKLVQDALTLSETIYMNLKKTYKSDYDKYGNSIRHFLLGRWLTAEDLPTIESANYNEYLERAITLYREFMIEHKTPRDESKYLIRARNLTLKCDLNDTSDHINADWLSDDIPSLFNELIQIGGMNPDNESALDLDELKYIALVINGGGSQIPATENYVRLVVDPFINKSVHGSCSSIPTLRLFYKLKRVLDRTRQEQSLEGGHFDGEERWDS